MNKEVRIIKFHLDKTVNNTKRERLYNFLMECQSVQNQLYSLYWDDELFKIIIKSSNKINFNYSNSIKYTDINPVLKSHHFQQVLQQVYSNLKSIETNIINKMYFKFDDKDKQKVYNYFKGFCFDWDRLETHIERQLKKNKKDKEYVFFLNSLSEILSNTDEYELIKQEIENKFWDIKSRYKIPQKKEFQILCSSHHTIDYEFKQFNLMFILDINDRIGGTDKKGVYDKLVIPLKYSDYHKKILLNKTLLNTFNLKLNSNGNIEIIAHYEQEIIYPKNDIDNSIGVDLGLKKLITSSDGEVVEQNLNVINKLNKINSKINNRNRLESHLKMKYNDSEFRLPNKRYLLKEYGLTNYVKCDNRFRVKQFLLGREHTNIIMEDLNISQSATYNKLVNKQLRRMMIQGLKNDIIKYSKLQGNMVSLVNPAYTSQQCSKCGHVSKDNRKTQEMFCCVECGHTMNADFNASINIESRYYDDRITLNMKPREVLTILTN